MGKLLEYIEIGVKRPSEDRQQVSTIGLHTVGLYCLRWDNGNYNVRFSHSFDTFFSII